MIIIGERLNSSRPEVLDALRRGDDAWLVAQAKKQEDAGAAFIDLNCAALLEGEAEAMTRLVPLLQERLSVPLSIDSPNAAALEAGLKAHRGRPLLNSISGESAKLGALLPLVGEYRPRIIALCLDDDGLPGSPEKSLEIALRLAGLLTERGLAPGDIFLDPLVRPVGVDPGSVHRFLDALEMITSSLPGFASVAGLSNVSFGMPARRLLNRTFLVLCLQRGLDAAILDPLDEEIMGALSAAECLLGGQEPIRRFLKRARRDKA